MTACCALRNPQGTDIELNDEQIRLLERFSPEFRERQIEVHYTGELVAVDTFFVGALKGVGKVYLQTVLDCYSRHAWGRLYTSKLPVTSVHVLNETVLPFFGAHEARVYTILSDNGNTSKMICWSPVSSVTCGGTSPSRYSWMPPKRKRSNGPSAAGSVSFHIRHTAILLH